MKPLKKLFWKNNICFKCGKTITSEKEMFDHLISDDGFSCAWAIKYNFHAELIFDLLILFRWHVKMLSENESRRRTKKKAKQTNGAGALL